MGESVHDRPHGNLKPSSGGPGPCHAADILTTIGIRERGWGAPRTRRRAGGAATVVRRGGARAARHVRPRPGRGTGAPPPPTVRGTARRAHYAGHPLAALPGGFAARAIDRDRGRATVAGAREELGALGDSCAEGHACFLEGLADLDDGDLEGGAAWWARSRDLLPIGHPLAGVALAHLSLGAYHRGSLPRALVLAEGALSDAEHRRDARLEGLAAVYVAFYHFWIGDFMRVGLAVDQAERAFDRIPDPLDRREAPLARALAGALAAVSGEHAEAEAAFATALADADGLADDWLTAVAQVARAQFRGRAEPARSREDAQRALDHLDRVGERWWRNWARQAMAEIHLSAGDLHAARSLCQVVLADATCVPEVGRALLLAGAIGARRGDPAAAADLAEAANLLESAGATFLAARAEVLAVPVDTQRSTYLLRRADERAGAHAGHPAWRRLLRGRGSIEIQVLGGAEVRVDGVAVRFKTRAELETIAMLAEAGPRGRSCAVIADRLWPDADPDAVAHRLDGMLSSLRRALLPTTRLRRAHGVVSLDLCEEECDLLRARAAYHRLGAGEALPADADVLADLARRPFLGDVPPEWAQPVAAELEAMTDFARRAIGDRPPA